MSSPTASTGNSDHNSFCVRDRSAYFPDLDVLVLADLHLGRGRESPIDLPLDGTVKLADRIAALLDLFAPETVVLLGDILDAFHHVPDAVQSRLDVIVHRIESRNIDLVMIAGNHDVLLDDCYAGNVQLEWSHGETVFVHGHREPESDGTRVVLGHEHPALRIEGVKHPCYLYGSGVYDGADLFVLPTFSPLLRGTAFNHHSSKDCDAPVLQSSAVYRCQPIVRDDDAGETFRFPTLADLRSIV